MALKTFVKFVIRSTAARFHALPKAALAVLGARLGAPWERRHLAGSVSDQPAESRRSQGCARTPGGLSLLDVLVALVLIAFLGGAVVLLQARLAKTTQRLLQHYRSEMAEHPPMPQTPSFP